MKVIGIILVVVIVVLLFQLKSNQTVKTQDYKLQGKIYRLLTAKTPEEWEKGLMFVRSKRDFDGMLFIFPDNRIRTFWNKNTFMNLRVYWLKDDEVVEVSELPSIEKTKEIKTVSSPEEVNKVIEIIE